MTLPEIDGRLPRPRATYFGRRRPWGAHFARSGNIQNTHPAEDLTRRWAHGPAKSLLSLAFDFGVKAAHEKIEVFVTESITDITLWKSDKLKEELPFDSDTSNL